MKNPTKRQRKDRRRYLRRRNVGHVPLHLPAKQGLGLQVIADRINDVVAQPPRLEGDELEAWRTVRRQVVEPLVPALIPPRPRPMLRVGIFLMPAPETLLSGAPDAPLPEWAASKFNQLSRQSTARLAVKYVPQVGTSARIETRTELDRALAHVWLYLFQERGWERLKKCRVCGRWFADRTLNRNRTDCSRGCSNRFWSRPQRRIARHKRMGAGKRRKGGPRAKARLGVPRSAPGR